MPTEDEQTLELPTAELTPPSARRQVSTPSHNEEEVTVAEGGYYKDRGGIPFVLPLMNSSHLPAMWKATQAKSTMFDKTLDTLEVKLQSRLTEVMLLENEIESAIAEYEELLSDINEAIEQDVATDLWKSALFINVPRYDHYREDVIINTPPESEAGESPAERHELIQP